MTLYFGADYYPEQWPEAQWKGDARLMADAGFNAVRVGEFAWSRMETADGVFNWGWLDRVLDILHKHGVGVVLCTPTASAPLWTVEACPGLLYVNYNRDQRPTGGRRQYCYNNDAYRFYTERIASALAERYSAHPALIGWEIDNEFAQEFTGRCCCSVCERKFRSWLRNKYGQVDALNAAWGTVFWSQEFSRWDQITAPRDSVLPQDPVTQTYLRQNPSWLLDYERFCSDSICDFQNLQAAGIRKYSQKPICHNCTGFAVNFVDYWKLNRNLDRGGLDCYPSVVQEDPISSSRDLSQARNMAPGPSWIMEMSSGGGPDTWSKAGKAQAPDGSLKLMAWHTYVNGAELALYFQWRIFPRGTEQLESAILDLDGVPRRKYREIASAGKELQQHASLITDTTLSAKIGLVWSYDDHWALGIKPTSANSSYSSQHLGLYRSLYDLGAGVDVISYDHDLTAYTMLVLQSPILMNPGIAEKLKAYVAAGGVLVTTFLTAVKDSSNGGFTDRPLPGYLDDLFGVIVSEVDPGAENLPTSIMLVTKAKSGKVEHAYWTDILELHGAEALGRIVGSWRKGEPVITRRSYGKGCAYYLGTYLGAEGRSAVFAEAAAQAGIQAPSFAVPDRVERVVRTGAQGDVTFLLNWNFKDVEVTLDGAYRDRLTDRLFTKSLVLSPREVAALSRA